MKEILKTLNTPCFVVSEELLIKNLEKIKKVTDATGAKVLLAQKGFSMYSTYPLLSKYLAGTTASSLFEAKLGKEEFGKETHIFAPAYLDSEIDEIIKIADHMVFNSFNQYNKYKEKIKKSGRNIQIGLRLNPEYSEIETDIYNPCFKNSRLGITLENLEKGDFADVDGIHFHTMCEQNSDTLKRTIKVVDEKFSKYLKQVKWVNFGGGHHIAREDYDIDTLIECILFIKNKYDVDVYLEPGEGIALNTGFLVSEVLDIVKNGMNIAIMDASAACHMPDVLEMPYRPYIIDSFMPNEKEYTYRLGGNTCLAGDIIGDYSFEKPLKIGDKLIFTDMAHYSMVKTNTFNGINLPDIVFMDKDRNLKTIKKFEYEDFKRRL